MMLPLIYVCLLAIVGCCNGLPEPKKDVCATGYTYRYESGKCYRDFDNLPMTEKYSDFNTLSNGCTVKHLSIISTKDDLNTLRDVVTKEANVEQLWLAAKYDTPRQTIVWYDNTTLDKTLFDKVEVGPNNCYVVKFDYLLNGTEYRISSAVKTINCSEKASGICEYETPACDPITIEDFDLVSMKLTSLRSHFVNNNATIDCNEGFFRENVKVYYVTCQALPNGGIDLNVVWTRYDQSNKLPKCKKIECAKLTTKFKNVQNGDSIFMNDTYGYNDMINVKCSRGYVDYKYRNNSSSSIRCAQSKTNNHEGSWEPQSLTPCVAVRCNLDDMNRMRPEGASFVEARNRVTNKEYNAQFQMSSFSLFDNIVDIKCDSGLFYPDRQLTKSIICDLKNQSDTESIWNGYTGTQLPLPNRCEAVSCLYEDVMIKTEYNLQSLFRLTLLGGTAMNLTKHTGSTYNYTNSLTFFCVMEYSTANQESSQTVKCESEGQWIPRLTSCIKNSEKVDTGNKKRYDPPPIDVEGAQQISVIVIVILVIFLSIIVILDLSTITRDIKLFKKNVYYLRKHMKENDNDSSNKRFMKKAV